MKGNMLTAVAAAADCSTQQMLVHVLSAAKVNLCQLAPDGFSAMDALKKHRPDLLVADMHLPGMEGSALVRRAACSFRLPVRPAAILMYHPFFPVSNRETLEAHGVILLEKPCTANVFCAAVRKLQDGLPVFSPLEIARANALVCDLGLPDHIGRDCLRAAILLVAADERRLHSLGSALYPIVGIVCGISAQQAERAIRHAIDLAWQSSKFEYQYRIFADTIDAGRGQPTCGQMISRLADILRLEG